MIVPRILPIAVVGLLLAGCANEAAGPGGSSGNRSGIRGSVVIGPQCPVQVIGSPCPDAPFPARIEVVGADGATVASADTDQAGTFTVAVDPGAYTIRAEPLGPTGIARMQPLRDVEVRANAYTKVTVTFDSGIR